VEEEEGLKPTSLVARDSYTPPLHGCLMAMPNLSLFSFFLPLSVFVFKIMDVEMGVVRGLEIWDLLSWSHRPTTSGCTKTNSKLCLCMYRWSVQILVFNPCIMHKHATENSKKTS